MSHPAFSVNLTDLEAGPKSARWSISEDWLRQALQDVEAEPRDSPGSLELELTKDGPQVIVRGHAQVPVVVPCARTLDPVEVEVTPEIFLVLSPATPKTAGRSAKTGGRAKARKGKPQPEARSGSHPKHRQTKDRQNWADDPQLGDADAAQDLYTGEEIVLDDFVREFILLELPMFPARQDLPSGAEPAIGSDSASQQAERPIDPRLMPLAEIASRLRKSSKE